MLSNELFKAASVSEWDIVHWFKTVADMGSIDAARRAATILTRGTRLIPSDPEEGLKYYLQAAAGGVLASSQFWAIFLVLAQVLPAVGCWSMASFKILCSSLFWASPQVRVGK